LDWKKGICGICPAGCWIEAGIKENKLVDIKLDASHSLGMMCRRGKYAPEIVHSKHRLRYPLKRIGPKGSFKFKPITWDEAYDAIASNFNKMKADYGAESVAIYTGRGSFDLALCDMFQPKGVAVSSASNILFPFGSPNTMGVGALCYVSFAMIAPHVTMGRMLINMFTDIENAEMLLVWGSNPATDSPPLDMFRLEVAAKRGADIVVIDPRRTETALRTGAQWIPIRPGTDGALALSLIQVMIEEDLFDDEFAETWCHGFKELKSYTRHFNPGVVESITGVPSETIKNIARRICKAKGSCPVMYTGLEYSNSGIQAIRAVLSLFALAGHLDTPGGIGLAMDGSHFPINRACNQANPQLERAVARDKFPLYSNYRGESHASGLVDSELKGEPYKIRSLIVQGASLLTSWPQTRIWRETLSKLEFLACIDRQLTADMAFADIVMPATTMFENYSYMTYGPIFRLRERLIEPIFEARNDYLIMSHLAERLGYGNLFPQTEEKMIRFALEGSGFTLDEIKQAGGSVKIPTPVIEYKKWRKGTLRKDKQPGFETPTGKFEICSTVLEEYGYEPLPKYKEPVEGPLNNPDVAKSFPLVFNSGARTQNDFRSQHHGIKGLSKRSPEPSIEINIEDARERQIASGDLVEVSTLRGMVPFRAMVTDNIVRGVVECNMGGGTPVGSNAWQNWNVNELTDISNYDEISGFPVYKALLCEVKLISKSENKHDRVKEGVEAEGCNYSKLTPQFRPKQSKRIYLDNNASTILAREVHQEMARCIKASYANPSSIHGAGREAKDSIEQSRRKIAQLINVSPKRIVFTSGGSESNNLAIKGIAFGLRDKGNHIITTKIEHPSVMLTCRFLEKLGYKVTYLDVDDNGTLCPDTLRNSITHNTVLVSMMMANNEVGTVLPVRELCAIAHEKGIIFHSDAVQAVGKIPLDADELGIDVLSISGHKFHGPKGSGALFLRKGIIIAPLIHGGLQEGGLRSGTENVLAIVGIGKAAELALDNLERSEDIRTLRDRLEQGIKQILPEAITNGHPTERLPNTLNMTLPRIRGESLVIAMDQHGISLSSGSACKSGSPEPTHVLIAMGKSIEDAHCSVRFSLSRYTTDKEIEKTLSVLKHVLLEMGNTVHFLPCK
jgi:cysteine desulfurase NifS